MLLVPAVFFWALSPLGWALQQKPDAAPPSGTGKGSPAQPGNLILGTVAGLPGTTIAIPLYYQASHGSSIRSLHLEVEFVSNSVKFGQAEKGVASGQQDFDLAVAAQELPKDEKDEKGLQHTRLSIDVTVADSDHTKTLPEGLWAFLNFRIPTDAKPFSISLNPVSTSAQDAAQKPVPVNAEAGKIIVSIPDEPLAGCFFFTH